MQVDILDLIMMRKESGVIDAYMLCRGRLQMLLTT